MWQIQIDTALAQRSVKELGDRITKMESKASKETSRLTDKFAGIGTLGLAAAGVAVGKMGGFLAKGLRELGTAEDIFGRIAVKTRASTEALAAAQREAIRVGKETTSSNLEAAAALEELTQSGLSLENSTKLLSDTVNFSAATNYGMADSAKFATSVLKVTKGEMSDFAKISDIAASATSATTLKINDLVTGFNRGAGAITKSGESFEEFSALLGLAFDRGTQATIAGTGLIYVFNELAGGTQKADAALGKLGVSIFNADGSAKDYSDTLWDLIEAAQTMSDQERSGALGAIFGESALKVVNPLLTTTREEYDALVNTMRDSAGLTAELQEKAMSSLAGAFEDLSGDIETVRFEILQPFSPLVNAAVRNTGKSIVAMADIVMPAVTGLADVLKTVFLPDEGTIGESLTRFLGEYSVRVATEFNSLGENLRRRWDEVLANVFGRANTSARDVFAYVRSSIEEIALNAGNLDFSDINQAFRDALSGIFDLSGERTLIDVLVDFFATGDITNLTDEIDDLFGKVESAVKTWIDDIQLEVKTEFKPFDDVTSTTVQADLPETTTIVNPIITWWQTLADALRTAWDALNFPSMGDFLQNMFSGFDVSERAQGLHAEHQVKQHAAYVEETQNAYIAEQLQTRLPVLGTPGKPIPGAWVRGPAVEKFVSDDPASTWHGEKYDPDTDTSVVDDHEFEKTGPRKEKVTWKGNVRTGVPTMYLPDPDDWRPDEPGVQSRTTNPYAPSQDPNRAPVTQPQFANTGPMRDTVGKMVTTYPHGYRLPSTPGPLVPDEVMNEFAHRYPPNHFATLDPTEAITQPFEEWQEEQPGPGIATNIHAFFLEMGDALLAGWKLFRDELSKLREVDVLGIISDKMGMAELGAVSHFGHEDIGDSSGETVTHILSPLTTELRNAWNSVVSVWNNVVAKIQSFTVQDIVDAWHGLVAKVKGAFALPESAYGHMDIGNPAGETSGGMLSPLSLALAKGWQAVTGTWDAVVSAITNFSIQDIVKAWNGLASKINEALDPLDLPTIPEWKLGWDSKVLDTTLNDLKPKWDALAGWITGLFDVALPKVSEWDLGWDASVLDTAKKTIETAWQGEDGEGGFVGFVKELLAPEFPSVLPPAVPDLTSETDAVTQATQDLTAAAQEGLQPLAVEPLFANFTGENLSKAFLAVMPAGVLGQALATRNLQPTGVDQAILTSTTQSATYGDKSIERYDEILADPDTSPEVKKQTEYNKARVQAEQTAFTTASERSAKRQRRKSKGLIGGGIAGFLLGSLVDPIANYITSSMTEAMKLVDADWQPGDGMTQEQREKFLDYMFAKIPEDVTNFFAKTGDWMGAGLSQMTIPEDQKTVITEEVDKNIAWWFGMLTGKWAAAILEFRFFVNKTFMTVFNPQNWGIGKMWDALMDVGYFPPGFSDAYETEISKFTERHQELLSDLEKEGTLGEQAARIIDQPREDLMESWRSSLFDQFFPDFGKETVELWANRQIGQVYDSVIAALKEFFVPGWMDFVFTQTPSAARNEEIIRQYNERQQAPPTKTFPGMSPYAEYQWQSGGVSGSLLDPSGPAQFMRNRRDALDYQDQIDAGYHRTAGLGEDKESAWDKFLRWLGITADSGGSGDTLVSSVEEGTQEATKAFDKGFTDYFNNEFPDTSGLAIHELETMYGTGDDPPDKSFMGVTNLYSESSGVVLDGVMDSWNASVATINAAYDNIIGKANSVLKLADKMPKGPEQSALLSLQVTPPAAFAMGGTSQGGWAMVGEHGPELVHLKAGAQVYSAVDTDRIVNEFQKTNRTEQTNIYVNHMDDNAMQELVLKQNIRRAQRHFG